jgi:predicted Holliday junction resolvase-like endonuclease
VDYIIFDGISEGNLKKIIFLEVKSGTSTLNKNEKMIRETIQKKQVEYSEYRI